MPEPEQRSPVAIVTDSTSYLPPELLAREGIVVVPLYIVEGERQIPETEIDDQAAFLERLRRSERLPTTSQPSVGDFVAAYEPLLADGRTVVSIHISGGLSGTAESARQAAAQLEREGKGGERVHVIDSRTAAGGLGFLVLAAAAAARTSGTAAAVEQRVEAARASLRMWFGIDTLEYLRRGGRIGAARAWLGTALKLKPILTVDGEMVPVERVRTHRRLVERMVEYARELADAGCTAWAVQHVADSGTAETLVERCRAIFGCDPYFVSEIGPVLSVHTGPGLLGVGGIDPRLLT
ncbi:DegV family protein [Thermoleophilum album]|jgi:DegV family protein with EDD domain|uniref:DegV family protein n=1 Tax=Thermoleophilum album TaxID=29539 RepID=UPI00237C9D9B|nr:DegV family protein [Thermoleophilum album]WDT93380.1 DegV family protein [Thermoleophilum album]